MTTTDKNGLPLYQETDLISPFAPVLNAISTSVSAAFDANTRIWPVTNTSTRAALVTKIGVANISSAKPLFVWRADAASGQNLEYTKNGTTWYVYKSTEDTSDDSGWVNVTLLNNATSRPDMPFVPSVRRVGKTVHFRGHFAPASVTTGASTQIFQIPVGYRPPYEVRGLAFSTNRGYSPYGFYITAADGICFVQTPAAGNPQYPAAHFSINAAPWVLE